jgi:hypothetical protein
MTKPDTERVDRLLFAELTYKPDVGARYTAASNTRMRALKALLLAAQAGAIFRRGRGSAVSNSCGNDATHRRPAHPCPRSHRR